MSELARYLVEAAYVADGGELPKMHGHLQVHRAKYAAIVAAVLRSLPTQWRGANGDYITIKRLKDLASEVESGNEGNPGL